MTSLELNAIATRAIIDPKFMASVLTEHRRDSLVEFSLPKNILDDIIAIDAKNLQQFLVELNEITKRVGNKF